MNYFTVSHLCHKSFLLTLKPQLKILTQRLDTCVLLGLKRLGVSPNYLIYTELAHPPTFSIYFSRIYTKKKQQKN